MSAFKLENCKKILSWRIGKFAAVFKSLVVKSCSEAIRSSTSKIEKKQHFILSSSIKNKGHIKHIHTYTKFDKSYINSYLTGLIEGSGALLVPKFINNTYYPSIRTRFNVKNLPLLIYIQSKLGYGSIKRFNGDKSYFWIIDQKMDILDMVMRIRPNIKTYDKFYYIQVLMDYYGLEKYDSFVWDGEKSDLCLWDNIKNTPWFSGFLECKGEFFVTEKHNTILCRFQLQWQDFLNKNKSKYLKKENTIQNIAKIFSSELVVEKKSNYLNYIITTINKASNYLLVSYLRRFQLFGYKHLDFLDWKQVLKINNEEIIDTIKIFNIKSEMKENRKDFSWNHLMSFYK